MYVTVFAEYKTCSENMISWCNELSSKNSMQSL